MCPYSIGETIVPATHPASGAILHLVNLKKVAAAEVGPQLPGEYSPETMLVWDFSGEGEGELAYYARLYHLGVTTIAGLALLKSIVTV